MEAGDARVLPEVLDVGHEAWHEEEVAIATPQHLVRDVDVAILCVPRLRLRRATLCHKASLRLGPSAVKRGRSATQAACGPLRPCIGPSWRWRESNPRPRVTGWVFYGRSRRLDLTSSLPAAEELSASPGAMSGVGPQAGPSP